MGKTGGFAIGARAKIVVGEESTYGTFVPVSSRDIALEGLITSEAIANEIGDLRSGALRPDRGLAKRVRGTSSVGGAINYEQNPNGLQALYKHAFGRHTVIEGANGGIRGILNAAVATVDATMAVKVRTDADGNAFPTGGGALSLVYNHPTIDDNRKTDAVTYASAAYVSATKIVTFTFATTAGAAGLDETVHKGAWCFLRKVVGAPSTPDEWDEVYTHVFEAGKELAKKTGNAGATLSTSLTVEVGRDVAVFTYAGMKANSMTETNTAGEMLTGSVDLLGRSEYIGTVLDADSTVGQTSITVKATSDEFGEFPASGSIIVGKEKNITYTGKTATTLTGIPASGSNSLELAHVAGEPVGIETTATAVAATTDPFSSFEAVLFIGGEEQEVSSCEWTLSNDIFADKFQLGKRFRAQAPEQGRTTEGTMNVEFDDLVLYRKFVDGTEFALEVRTTSESQVINSAAASANEVAFQKHIIFPNAEYTGTTPQAGDQGIITHDLPFVAMTVPADELSEITMILVNNRPNLAN